MHNAEEFTGETNWLTEGTGIRIVGPSTGFGLFRRAGSWRSLLYGTRIGIRSMHRPCYSHNFFPDYRLSSATLFWYKPGTCCCFCGFERMARNKVQFQKGLSEAQFATLYGTEDLCREVLTRWRWPSGFVCPVCGGKHHSIVKTRALYQCTA